MPSSSVTFANFRLDPDNRRLTRDGATVELSGRYLDALALLVTEAGRLVTKDRFMAEVWRGVPVTDEALTQCIRALRRALGDDAARPRFIETVPKHGYRFIAAVEGGVPLAPITTAVSGWQRTLILGSAGMLGGGAAGFGGGLAYGLAGAAQPAAGMGAISILLVILCATIVLALAGGAGVAFGIAVAGRVGDRFWRWAVAGGAIGGALVGGAVKLLGLDAFTLVFGAGPHAMTGGVEGLILGAATGLGGWLAWRWGGALRRSMALAAASGAGGGALIALTGGRLMAGSLHALAEAMPRSRLRLGGLFGEGSFGPLSNLATAIAEGALFAACVVGAMLLARRQIGARR